MASNLKALAVDMDEKCFAMNNPESFVKSNPCNPMPIGKYVSRAELRLIWGLINCFFRSDEQEIKLKKNKTNNVEGFKICF